MEGQGADQCGGSRAQLQASEGKAREGNMGAARHHGLQLHPCL